MVGTANRTATGHDLVTHRLYPDGTPGWATYYSVPNTQFGRDACIDGPSVITVGSRFDEGPNAGGQGHAWLFESRHPETGNLYWRRDFNPTGQDHNSSYHDTAYACYPSHGSFLVAGRAGTNQWRVERRWSGIGSLQWAKQGPISPGWINLQKASDVVASDGEMFVVGMGIASSGGRHWGIHKRSEYTGDMDTTFGNGGRVLIQVGGVGDEPDGPFVALDDEYVYIAGSKGTPHVAAYMEVRDRMTGALVWSAQRPSTTRWTSIAISGNNIILGGADSTGGSGNPTWLVDVYARDTHAHRGSFAGGTQQGEVRSVTADAGYAYLGGYADSGGRRRWHYSKLAFDCNGNGVPDITETGLAPEITGPFDAQGCAGATPVFSITLDAGTSGSAVSCQWRKNGVSIPGATALSYQLTPADASAEADYDCVVANACGWIVSPTARFELIPPAFVTNDTGPQLDLCLDDPAVFSASVVEGALAYQWSFQGSAIPGATSRQYVITDVNPAHAGPYTVSVTTPCGSYTSDQITQLSVNAPPTVTPGLQPLYELCSGPNIDLSIGTSSDPLASIHWFKDTIQLATGPDYTISATGETLTVLNAAPGDSGPYRCVIQNPCGSVVSSTVLIVHPSNQGGITITQTGSSPACPGDTVQLEASGGSGGGFVWYKDSVNQPSVATGSTYVFQAPTSDTLYFARRESGDCNDSPEAAFPLAVRAQPLNDTCAGSILLFGDLAAGMVQAFDNTCVPDNASIDTVRKGVWYSFASLSCGTGNATVNAGFPSQIAIYEGNCTASLPVAAGPASVDFTLRQGVEYFVHVGSAGNTGGLGNFVITAADSPNCPDPLKPSRANLYVFNGTASGQPWSWKLVSGDCTFQELLVGSVPALAFGAPPEDVATAFANSINAASQAAGCIAGELRAVANPFSFQGRMSIRFHSDLPSGGLELWVGPENSPTCFVTTSSTGSDCQFILPGISVLKEDIAEDDCNENALPDFLDILLGNSEDLNGDGIPDECASGEVGRPYCFGDGTSFSCPCGNNSDPSEQAGCRNSTGQGARLTASGRPSLSADTLVLDCVGMPNSTALLLQGSLGSASLLGDGYLCVGGAILRLGVTVATAGSTRYPAPGEAPLSVQGQVMVSGTTTYYQLWHRDTPTVCTNAGYNLSNAVEIQWIP